MSANSFDAMIRSLTVLPSRRDVLHGLAGAGIGLGLTRLPEDAGAKKKRKHKKKAKKAKPNAFGCLEVGDACKSADQCCSGLCEGKKGKRTCRAHDTGTCDQKAAGVCEAGNYYAALCNGDDCFCIRTTAGSNVCGGIVYQNGECADCQKDADCLAQGFPPGSACAPIGGDFICAGLCEHDMACIAPCDAEFPEPMQ